MTTYGTNQRLPRWGPRALWAAPFAAVIILMALTAACSGGAASPDVADIESTPGAGDDSADDDSSGSNDSSEPDVLAYSQCMRANGVPNFPDPNSEGQIIIEAFGDAGDLDPNSPQFQAAQAACKSLEPRPSAEQQAQDHSAFLEYAQCMRDQGVSNFPDPQPGGGLQLDMGALGLDPNSPQYQAAEEACNQYLPGGAEGRSFNSSFNDGGGE